MEIGVLDIQGSVEEHIFILKKCGVNVIPVKTVADLKAVTGLIIPGGESTTIGKLLKRFGLFDEIIKKARAGMAIWGTCAGAILLAKKIIGQEGKIAVDNLGLMDITIARNAYGRQIDSFETEIDFDMGKISKKIPAVFIRAPKIMSVEKNVKILASYEGEIVAALQGKFLATTFHPEMTMDLSIHKFFIEMC
ncbi:MAG: pyridoxal 5'-phosphate synthase glutaminase subunit PdxT [Candidatus Gracilibacteria bacterium]